MFNNFQENYQLTTQTVFQMRPRKWGDIWKFKMGKLLIQPPKKIKNLICLVRFFKVGPWIQQASLLTHLVEAEEAEVPHNVQSADPGARGDLSSHLQSDLNNLQRVRENHLGRSSLRSAADVQTEMFSSELFTCRHFGFSQWVCHLQG